ncbi:MAG: hypothetical protein Q8P01_02050 [bacterium]|nr:hypothetical protein [bacterium]MDP2703983.1 hypothetical protein [bacterium]
MFKRLVFVIAVVALFLVPSLIAGAGEWKVLTGTTRIEPDGTYRGILIVREMPAGVEHQITNPDEVNAGGASWTPDGKIVFSNTELVEDVWVGDIRLMDADGSNMKSIGIDDWGVGSASRNFISFTFIVGGATPWVGVVRRDGSDRVDLAPGMGSAISHDETKVAFYNGQGGINVINIDGTNLRTDVVGLADSSAPEFVDDHQIAYTGIRGRPGQEIMQVFIHNLDTGEETFLGDGGLTCVTGEWIVYTSDRTYAIRPDGTDRFELQGSKGTDDIIGDISPTSDPGPIEEPRAVNPHGKMATTWAELKARK